MPQSLELSSVCIVEATGKVVKEVKVETHPEALAKFFKDFGLDIVRHDEVCRRFMTTPSVGAIVAITYKSALDDPNRIKKSRNAGPLFGLTPKIPIGRNRRHGWDLARWRRDGAHGPLRGGERVALSGHALLCAQALGLEVAKRRGLKRAKVAVARKLAVILHRMWLDGTTFRWTKTKVAHARSPPIMAKPIVPRPRSSPSTPLRLRRKPRRGFGGVTARLGRAKDAAMPCKATCICFDHGG